MLSFLDGFRALTLPSIALRMLMAVICGGLVGMEREYKRRPAGFRTHILICVGASITTMTSVYLMTVLHYTTDISRLGAQVIAGIGFIGAGTIIVTNHQRVRGITTAAGLWTVAIVGLAIGAGFYEGAVLTTVLVLFAESVFSKLEHWITRTSPEIYIFVEYGDRSCLEDMVLVLRQFQVKVLHLEIKHSRNVDKGGCAICSLRLPKKCSPDELLLHLRAVPGIESADEF